MIHLSREEYDQQLASELEADGGDGGVATAAIAARYPISTLEAQQELAARGLKLTAHYANVLADVLDLRLIAGSRVWTAQDIDAAAAHLERVGSLDVYAAYAKSQGITLAELHERQAVGDRRLEEQHAATVVNIKREIRRAEMRLELIRLELADVMAGRKSPRRFIRDEVE